MSDARDCGVGVLLIEPVGLQLETVFVVDWASVRRNSPRQVSKYHLVDGVTSKSREDFGDGVLGALEVLDFDRVLYSRRDPPAGTRAAFKLFRQ